jgi:hypothetical protein
VPLDVVGTVSDFLHGIFQRLGRDTEFERPVSQFVVLVHIDSPAVLAPALAEIVWHVSSPDSALAAASFIPERAQANVRPHLRSRTDGGLQFGFGQLRSAFDAAFNCFAIQLIAGSASRAGVS